VLDLLTLAEQLMLIDEIELMVQTKLHFMHEVVEVEVDELEVLLFYIIHLLLILEL